MRQVVRPGPGDVRAPTTELREFLAHVNRGALIEGGSPHTGSCTGPPRRR